MTVNKKVLMSQFLYIIYSNAIAVGIHIYEVVANHINPSRNSESLPFNFSNNSLSNCMILFISINQSLNYFYIFCLYPTYVSIFKFNLFPILHGIVLYSHFCTFVKYEKIGSLSVRSILYRHAWSHDNSTVMAY